MPIDVVGRRDLDHLAAEAEADHHVVIEVDRARRLGRDPLALEARLREDQHLRRLGDVECAEQRPQVAVLRLVLELRRPRGEPLLELRDRILRRRLAVVDRLALDVLRRGRRGRNVANPTSKTARQSSNAGRSHVPERRAVPSLPRRVLRESRLAPPEVRSR